MTDKPLRHEPRSRHVSAARKLAKQIEDELGTYEEGGPAIVVPFPEEGPGLTKRLDRMSDDELGKIEAVHIHARHGAHAHDDD